MAIATRIAQDAQIEGGFVKAETTDYRIYAVDGKEVDRARLSDTTVAVLDRRRFIQQPDRVRLDLSMDEAQTLLTVVGAISGAYNGPRRHTEAIFAALLRAAIPHTHSRDAGLTGRLTFPLYGVSSGKGTDASSGGAGCSPVDPTAGQADKARLAAIRSGYDRKQAQLDAELKAKLNAVVNRW